MKRAEFINISYLTNHAEEIINNTDVIFPYWQWLASRNPVDDGDFLMRIWNDIEKNNSMNPVIGIFLVGVILGLVRMKLGRKLKIVLSESIVKLLVIGIYLSGRK